MTPSGTTGALNDTLSIYVGDMTLANETLWQNLAFRPAERQRSSPFMRISIPTVPIRWPVYSQEICRKSDRASKRCWRPIG